MPSRRRSGLAPATLLPWASLRCPSHTPPMEPERAKICQFDYESFTHSWLAADKNAGGRTPRVWASCANHDNGTSPR